MDFRECLITGMDEVGIKNKIRYISKLIASDLLINHTLSDDNYAAIKDLLDTIKESNNDL